MKNNLQETVSRIRALMNLNENDANQNEYEEEYIEVPEDVLKDIEDRVDANIASAEAARKELESMSDMLNNLPNADLYKPYIDQRREELTHLSSVENRQKYIENQIKQYQYNERYRRAMDQVAKDREENIKTAQLTDEEIGRLLGAALDGGSNFWYHILFVPNEITHVVKTQKKNFIDACVEFILDGGVIPIHDREENGDPRHRPKPLGYLDMDSAREAIEIIKNKYPNVYGNIVTEEYDSDDTDVFLQVAVMGKIEFG